MPFSVHTMALSGELSAFIVEEFVQNGGSSIMTQRAFRIRFALGRRDPVPDKKKSQLSVELQTDRISTGGPPGNRGPCESFDWAISTAFCTASDLNWMIFSMIIEQKMCGFN
jgi:hypothetical protein